MRFVEVQDKSKEKAIEKALQMLDTTIDKVKVECEEQKSAGIFGFLAKTEYRVKVTLLDFEEKVEIKEENTSEEKQEIIDVDLEDRAKRAKVFLSEVFESIGIQDVDIQIDTKENNLNINILGQETSRLIGRRGESLDSLQFLTSLAVNKSEESYVRVVLDIENYREKREESLTKYANKMARQAAKQRRIIKLEPMNPYERRIVHSALQNDRYVKTYSEGKDPYRRVVIEPKYKN